MTLSRVNESGLVLLGCGKMGSAMLQGWLVGGLNHSSVTILDPKPSAWVIAQEAKGATVNGNLPKSPAVVVLAVKPQMMGEALPHLAALGDGKPVFISIAAGTTISALETVLGSNTPIIRAMPNTPAAIGMGITALFGNDLVAETDLQMAETLLGAVGKTVRLADEAQMDAVTAVSGSGPAYVFHLIETMAAAGEAEGLQPELAMALAKATVAGAGALAGQADEDPAQLRVNVTSPGGTTQAALKVLMDEEDGFPPLLRKAIAAAANRGRELG